MNAIDWVNQQYHKNKNLPSFKSGDSVKVHVKIKEGDKERIQVYEGVVIRIHRNGAGSTFTVRKISYGVGVERIFCFSSPSVHHVEVVTQGHVRQARLYYLRDLAGKKARIKSLDFQSQKTVEEQIKEAMGEENPSQTVVPEKITEEPSPKTSAKKTKSKKEASAKVSDDSHK